MHQISVAGHVCVDITPALGSHAQLKPGGLFEVGPARFALGGCVANTGGCLADLGARVEVHTAVGDDELGEIASRLLRAWHGLGGVPRRMEGESTSYSLVIEPDDVDRTFWHHVGVNAVFDGRDVTMRQGILHLGYPQLLPGLLVDDGRPLLDLLSRAKRAGMTTSLDFAVLDPSSPVAELDWKGLLESILPFVDIVSPSVDDLSSALTFEGSSVERARLMAEWLNGAGAAVAMVSAGTAGLCLRTASRDRIESGGAALEQLGESWAHKDLFITPSVVSEAVTTNGAGDAATAGLLFGVASGVTADLAVRLAAATAATVVAGHRPFPSAVLRRDPELRPIFTRRPVDVERPIVLPPNQPADRFYQGGPRISALRGIRPTSNRIPEDWIGSTTSIRDAAPVGETELADGRSLAQAIAADPLRWLGEAHVDRFGADTKLLVKLLDAGQRLPIHVHPDVTWASSELGVAHGKAEAWYILSPGSVYLGFASDLTRSELQDYVSAQDSEGLLARMHKIDVDKGDRVFVPPGMAHAIGAGVLLAEVQEPEDLSILLEWRDFDIDGRLDGHLGVGFESALSAVDLTALSQERIGELVHRASNPGSGLPRDADPFFRLNSVDVRNSSNLPEGFAILICLSGDLNLVDADQIDSSSPVDATFLGRGVTVLLPAASRARRLEGWGSVLVAQPPEAGIPSESPVAAPMVSVPA